MHTDTAWYILTTNVANQIDSVAIPSREVIQWQTIGCRLLLWIRSILWPEYYRYTYDSVGAIIDSSLVVGDTTLSITSLVVQRYTIRLYGKTMGHMSMRPIPFFLRHSVVPHWMDSVHQVCHTIKATTETYGVADYHDICTN